MSNEDGMQELSSKEAFRLRMECQCHQIERYRVAEMRDGGRNITLDEAAFEWIALHADEFAQSYEFAVD